MGNFMDDITQESKKYGGGQSRDMFEFDNKGVYKMRLLVQPKVLATHFFGKGNPSAVCIGIDEGCPFHGADDAKPSIKLVTYIIDRKDAKIKLAELPLSLSYSIKTLQEDADFAFSEFPMEYDIKVNYDPDNKDRKSIYTLTPSPTKEQITDEEQGTLLAQMNKMTPEQYVEKRKEKQKSKGAPAKSPDYPSEMDGEIPF